MDVTNDEDETEARTGVGRLQTHGGNAVSTETPTYADDLALIITSNTRDLRIQSYSINLSNYSDWARIKVNVSKCAITGRKYVGGIEQQIEKTHYKNITYKHPEKGTHTFPFRPANETYVSGSAHFVENLK
eukprot:2772449-Pyramimonas_sp.AAC.2